MLKHKKVLIFIILIFNLSFSQNLENEKFQLIAQKIDSKDNIVTAKGRVVIFSPSYYLSAEKVIYNKKNKSFELFSNVVIIKNNTLQTQSDYAFINMQSESYSQKPLFLYERNSNLWATSRFAKKKEELIQLENSIISSCDCLNPDWSIKVSSANYNEKNKWINAYNPRLYIKNIPILYLPYIGFPTDKTRRSGLLIPTIGYSNSKGIYYSQPIYFALKDNYDIQIVPQFRYERGYGIYGYLRYMDSLYSQLNFKTGIFKEKKKYQINNNLDNDLHYGLDFNYKRTKLFSNDKTQDGFYSSITYLNDIEYITLENDDDISTAAKVESKINYFYNTSKYYGGLYAKYYIDTSLDSNDTTLQELPQLQFHSYNREIPYIKRLLYSIDSKFYNYTRKKGLNTNIYELTFPLSYNKTFIDDYLYINLENESTLSKYDYSNNASTIEYKDGLLLQNKTTLSFGSDLMKPYKKYVHTINLNAKYINPKNIFERGDLYDISTTKNSQKNNSLKSFPTIQDDKEIVLSINQSLYNKNSLKQFLNHKLSQSILYNKLDEPKFNNLKNYIRFNHDYGYLSNKITYNFQDNTLIEDDSTLAFNYKDIYLSLGYYKSKKTNNSNKDNLKSYRIDTSYKIDKTYKIGYYENYNILEKIRNKQGIYLNITDNCWNLNLKYEKEINPTTSISSNDGIKQKFLYIQLELKPIGGVNQKYEFEDN